MKSRIPVHLAAFGITICAALPSNAADIIKADNTTNLTDGASWAGGSAPGASDTAVFDATYTQTGSLDTGGAVSWAGLGITAGTSAINIANTTAENTISLGAGGVSLGAARSLTLPNTQWLANQVWSAVASSTLTVGATKIDAATFTLQLTSAGMTVKKGVTTLPFGGTSSLSKFVIGDDTLNTQPDAGTVTSTGDLTVTGHFAIGEAAPALFVQTAGTVHSTAAASAFGSGANLGHRGGNARYRLEGGTLRANAPLVMGAGGGTTGILEISGGTARLKGLNLTTSTSAVARIDLTAGRINLDSSGIVATATGTRTLNFGGGTLGATANWSSAQSQVFTGTGGNTTIDTLDAVDATTPRTITLSGNASGAGGFVKTGDGTLIIQGTFTHGGDSAVNGGTLELATGGRIRTFPTADEVSNRITGSGTAQLNGILEVDLSQAAIATGNSWLLVDATSTNYGAGFSVESTTGTFTPGGGGLHAFEDVDGNIWTFSQTNGRLSVTPKAPLVWTNAAANGLWDTISINWNDGSGNQTFTDGESVRFEDTANSVENISVVGTITPATMTFANTVTDFNLGGSGTIAGTSAMLVNNGGQVTLANAGGLTFTGALQIDNNSVARLGTSGGHGSTSINSGSTLELIGGASVTGPIVNNGSLLNTATTGTQTLATVISGSGGIVQNGAGTLELTAVNIHTGPVTTNSGIFKLSPAAQIYQTGAFFGLANQNYIIVNTGGTFETWNWNFGPANALSRLRHNYGQILLNGGTIRLTESFSSQRAFTVGPNGGTIEVGAGITYTKSAGTTVDENIIRFSANSTLTIGGDGNAVIGDALGAYGSTGFNIAKSGAGTLTLSGANTYTGTTTVSGGSLAVNGTALADASSLVINGGVVIPTGTETVGTLFFGATQQAAGTWGATGSGATNIDNTRFSGTDGVIEVITGPGGSGFASWATTNGTAGTIDQDHDNDGAPNGIEYFLGGPNGNTTGFTALPGVTTSAGTRSVTWTMAADYAGSYDTNFVVETSETLTGAWTEETLGVTVTITDDDVTYTFPAGPARKFVRLSVTGP